MYPYSTLQYLTFILFNDPTRSIVDIKVLRFRPDTLLKFSIGFTKFSNDSSYPSFKKVLSPAKSVCLISTSFILIPLMFSLFLIYDAKKSIHTKIKQVDKTQPCLTPFSILNYSEKLPLFTIILLISV